MNKTTNNLRQYRIKAGLRQLDAARLLGRDFTDRLSRWENGLAIPNITNLFRLAEIYIVPPEALYQDLRRSDSQDNFQSEFHRKFHHS
jgi:transcriptional regulator with XRE-family HTH domain